MNGGEEGIRTLGTGEGTLPQQGSAFDHSATSPPPFLVMKTTIVKEFMNKYHKTSEQTLYIRKRQDYRLKTIFIRDQRKQKRHRKISMPVFELN